jgi:hypothetical protein
MKATWIEVLIDPASIAQGRLPNPSVEMTAISYLFEGRTDEYERRAPEAGLPSFAQMNVEPNASNAGLLVQGFQRLMTDDPRAIDDLLLLVKARSASADLRAIAAVVAGIALRDAHRPGEAILLLQQCLDEMSGRPGRTLLLVHMGVALAETGDFPGAVAVSEQVAAASEPHQSTEATLHAIAAENTFQFQWAVGQAGKPPSQSAKWAFPPLAWVNAGIAEAADELVLKSFDSKFQDPLRRTWHLSNQDQIDSELAQALFRSARKRYARYRLIREEGRPSSDSLQALILLSRSGDEDGLKKAARTFKANGPLELLRDAGNRIVGTPWNAADVGGRLALLRETASVLDPTAASIAAERLMASLDGFLQRIPMSGWVIDDALDVLADLSNSAGAETANSVSATFRRLAEAPPDPLLHQSLGRSVDDLPWHAISSQERVEWIEYVRQNLSAKDDHVFVALGAVGALADLGDSSALDAALTSYRETKSLLLAPMVLDKLQPMEVKDLRVEALKSASALRDQAHRGSYQMHTLSPGGLLGMLAVSRGGTKLLKPLIDYATDPVVPVDERISAVRQLIRKPGALGPKLQARISHGIPGSQVSLPLFGDDDQLVAINLELVALFGDQTSDELIGSLLLLAHSPSAEIRTGAAVACRAVAQKADVREVGLILLGLTWDASPFVRATAGRVLCCLPEPSPDGSQSGLLMQRLDDLLDEDGEVVPSAIWRGLRDRVEVSLPIPERLLGRARLSAERHLSWHVRAAATHFLEGLDKAN